MQMEYSFAYEIFSLQGVEFTTETKELTVFSDGGTNCPGCPLLLSVGLDIFID